MPHGGTPMRAAFAIPMARPLERVDQFGAAPAFTSGAAMSAEPGSLRMGRQPAFGRQLVDHAGQDL